MASENKEHQSIGVCTRYSNTYEYIYIYIYIYIYMCTDPMGQLSDGMETPRDINHGSIQAPFGRCDLRI